jgi:hypothetical protein
MVWGFGFKVQDCMVQDFIVRGVAFRVYGLRFRGKG